jgi:hypothetical protein
VLGFGPPQDRQARRQWWRRQIQRQQDAGVPIAEFCRRLGVAEVTFYAWRRRLGVAADATSSSLIGRTPPCSTITNGRNKGFVPVSIIETTPTTWLSLLATAAWCACRDPRIPSSFAPRSAPLGG